MTKRKGDLTAIDGPIPPGSVIYRLLTVKANRAYRAGELNDRAIGDVLSDLNAALPAK